MSVGHDGGSARLAAHACRDVESLRGFVVSAISPNAWPIRCRVLLRRIAREGLDLDEAHAFSLGRERIEDALRSFHERSRRLERTLGIDNAFHRTIHNLEVLLRLLVLEWPVDGALPDAVRLRAERPYETLDAIVPEILATIDALADSGVAPWVVARDLLAALGHDYGHSGGTDRLFENGERTPHSHEDIAERHAALFGLSLGYPSMLVLESMAGIRATTFYSRPGRERVQPLTSFEKKLSLADVAGFVLPSHQWLTHVAVPVLVEKLPAWKRRMAAIPEEMASLRSRIAALPADDPEQPLLEHELAELSLEDSRIIKDLGEWLRSERGFLVFIEAHRLAPVSGARAMWGGTLRDRLSLIEGALTKEKLVASLTAAGFALLEDYARRCGNASSLAESLASDGCDARLRDLLTGFLPG
ncbi:MAG: hypothetical protein U0166_27225 [Acidobacteriota bacterium]